MKPINTFLNDADKHRVAVINGDIPGWSGYAQYGFFKAMFDAYRIERLLMLGVYHGRDLGYCMDILRRLHPEKAVTLVGVDKFSDTPCADWPEEKKSADWKTAGFGLPPDYDTAKKNLAAFEGWKAKLVLIHSEDEKYLLEHAGDFDAVYCDTSHDFDSISRQIKQCTRAGFIRAGGVICGDDYLERPEWGVIKAVDELLPARVIVEGCIWVVEVA